MAVMDDKIVLASNVFAIKDAALHDPIDTPITYGKVIPFFNKSIKYAACKNSAVASAL